MNYFCAGVETPENGLEEPLIKQFFEDDPDGLPTLVVADCLDISVPHLEETLDVYFFPFPEQKKFSLCSNTNSSVLL